MQKMGISLRKWLRVFFHIVLFAGLFEGMAQLGFLLREHTFYAPFSYLVEIFEGYKKVIVRTSGDGNRSSFYRHQKRSWAVFGTSWVIDFDRRQEDLWVSQLQNMVNPELVHIENFSTLSGQHPYLFAALRNLVQQGRHYEKIFLALDLSPPGWPVDPPPLASYFQHSSTWLNLEPRFPLSISTIKNLYWRSDYYRSFQWPWEKSLKSTLAKPVAHPDGAPLADLHDIAECYMIKIKEFGCKARYFQSKKENPKVDPWQTYTEVFKSCQLAADHACGVPPRRDEVPKINDVLPHYFDELQTFLRLARSVADQVYLVTHPYSGQPETRPDSLANDSEFFSIPVPENKFYGTTNRVGAIWGLIYTQNLIQIAHRTDADIIDVYQDLAQAWRDHPRIFANLAHLSKDGHKRVARIIARRLVQDDPTVYLSDE